MRGMQESRDGSTGHNLRNFCGLRRNNNVRTSMWCLSQYRTHPYDIFMRKIQWKMQGLNGHRKSIKGDYVRKDPVNNYLSLYNAPCANIYF